MLVDPRWFGRQIHGGSLHVGIARTGVGRRSQVMRADAAYTADNENNSRLTLRHR